MEDKNADRVADGKYRCGMVDDHFVDAAGVGNVRHRRVKRSKTESIEHRTTDVRRSKRKSI